ncbi:hypothetical protein KUF71_015347 [Frankliniella fusca]|uniref:RNA-directed DNA polymerase n=1 Tax=Frankliniella fusca TaxID=407009 RepID=A0AAE1HT76_9NEOP|nr:hypothetical protein KUF71_015347 [Frankliniella fusca]
MSDYDSDDQVFHGFDNDEIMEARLEELNNLIAAQKHAMDEQAAAHQETINQLKISLQEEQQKHLQLPATLLQLLGAGSSIPPPEQFTFVASDWPAWIKRYEQYKDSSPVRALPAQSQVNNLLYTMGPKANDIFEAFKWTTNQQVDYVSVKEKFDSHYIAKKTKLYERSRFNQRVQLPGEPVDTFITDLHTIGRKCEFGAMMDELIRDRIIAGMLNKTLSTALQNEENEPSLERVCNRARQSELVASHQHLLQSPRPEEGASAAAVSTNKNKNVKKNSPQPNNKDSNKPCGWCGYKFRHEREKCPARDNKCKHCEITGHYESQCRKHKAALQEASKKKGGKGKSIHNVEKNDNNPPPDPSVATINLSRNPHQNNAYDFFLSTVTLPDQDQNTVATAEKGMTCSLVQVDVPYIPPHIVNIKIGSCDTNIKVDNGADVTCIGLDFYLKNKGNFPELQDAGTLNAANHKTMTVSGQLKNIKIQYQDKYLYTTIYVLPGVNIPLLGRSEAIAFGLAKNIAAVDKGANVIAPEEEFKEVFIGLGKIPGSYTIQLMEDAKPVAISSPRHVAIPLREPIRIELEEMVKTSIIEPVEHPTQWCSPIVPVIKKKPDANGKFAPGSIRITVDYTALNNSVIRELYQLPTVEECFAQVAQCKLFSKLDASKSYFQVELTEDCRDLTTFITHIGRFRYQRMPMGLKSSSEIEACQLEDPITLRLKHYVTQGWPKKYDLIPGTAEFYNFRSDITMAKNMVTFQRRIYIPSPLRQEMLSKLHEGHQTEIKCVRRAQQSVWWPTINQDIRNMISHCKTCLENSTQRPEPMMCEQIPKHPWEIVGMDLGKHEGVDYLILIDAYSKYPFFYKMKSTRSEAIIEKIKPLFDMFGSPRLIKTDRGTQFVSQEFQQFLVKYDCLHTQSSSEHHQSNGLAEAGVKIIKNILKKNPEDPGRALQELRATPSDSGYSPAQLFLSRNIKTALPSVKMDFSPQPPPTKQYRKFLKKKQEKSKSWYDQKHRVKPLKPLDIGERVWVKDVRQYATVTHLARGDRSYGLVTEQGYQIIRNRVYLIEIPSGQSIPTRNNLPPIINNQRPEKQDVPEQRPSHEEQSLQGTPPESDLKQDVNFEQQPTVTSDQQTVITQTEDTQNEDILIPAPRRKSSRNVVKKVCKEPGCNCGQ